MATFSQAEIDAFKAAMLKNPGVKRMRIGDRDYEFDTLDAMQKRLEFMQLHVETRTSSSTTRYASTSKGLGSEGGSSRRYFRE